MFDLKNVRQTLDCQHTDVVVGEYHDPWVPSLFEPGEKRAQAIALDASCLDGSTSLNLRTNFPSRWGILAGNGDILGYGEFDCHDGDFLTPAYDQRYCDSGFSLSRDSLQKMVSDRDRVYLFYETIHHPDLEGHPIRGPNDSPTGVRKDIASAYYVDRSDTYLMVNRPSVEIDRVVRFGHRSADSVEVQFRLNYSHQISRMAVDLYSGETLIGSDTLLILTPDQAVNRLHAKAPIDYSVMVALPSGLSADTPLEVVLTPAGYGQYVWDELFPAWAVSATLTMPVGIESTGSHTGEWAVKAFPNPSVTGQVNLDLMNAPATAIEAEVFDMMGRRVYESPIAALTQSLALDLTQLPSGSYLVRLTSALPQKSITAVITITR